MTEHYLDPILKCHRLSARGTYELLPLTPTPEGLLYRESKVLGLRLCLDKGRLRLFDPAAGEFLPSHREVIAGHAEERRARKAAEAEIKELRRQLARR